MADGTSETQDQMPGNGQSSGESVGFSIDPGKRKRGRPEGSKNKTTPLDTGSTTKSRTPSPPTVEQVESAKFIGLGVVSLLELFESFIHSNGAKKIEKKAPEKLLEFKALCSDIGLKDKEKEMIQDAATRIASRYELMTKYAPELMLGVTLAQYGMRQIALNSFVEKVTKEQVQIPATTTTAKAA